MEIRGVKYKDIAFWIMKGTNNENSSLLLVDKEWKLLLEIEKPFSKGDFIQEIKGFEHHIGVKKFMELCLFGSSVEEGKKRYELRTDLKKLLSHLKNGRKKR